MVIIGVVFSAFFLLCNYLISDFDIFNPSFVFSLINYASLFVCMLLKNEYKFVLHENTIFVLLCGQIIFTLINFICNMNRKKSTYKNHVNTSPALSYIKIQSEWIVLFIIFELVITYFKIKYIVSISSAVFGSGYSLSEHIGNYNYAIKFMTTEFAKAGIGQNIILKCGTPIYTAFTYILIVVILNNYILIKKIDKLGSIAIVFSIALSVIDGSRSEAVRRITAAIAAGIILSNWSKGSHKKGNIKLIIKILFITIVILILILSTRSWIGRSTTYDTTWYRAVFPYFGAPIVNLDIYLNSYNKFHSNMWGEQTFYALLNYIGTKFKIKNLVYDLHLPFLLSNGISTGNVYTMYYMYIEDFGYLGILPLTSIVAVYYIFTYKKITNLYNKTGPLNMSFLIYIYMFNSLIMLLFSNRFYEQLLNIHILEMFVIMSVLWKIVKSGLLAKRIILH